jgi:hypothetical protein
MNRLGECKMIKVEFEDWVSGMAVACLMALALLIVTALTFLTHGWILLAVVFIPTVGYALAAYAQWREKGGTGEG